MEKTIRYRSGYKYQLAEGCTVRTGIFPPEEIVTEFISLNTLGVLSIRRGYAWDGASGPTIDTKSSMWGSLPCINSCDWGYLAQSGDM